MTMILIISYTAFLSGKSNCIYEYDIYYRYRENYTFVTTSLQGEKKNVLSLGESHFLLFYKMSMSFVLPVTGAWMDMNATQKSFMSECKGEFCFYRSIPYNNDESGHLILHVIWFHRNPMLFSSSIFDKLLMFLHWYIWSMWTWRYRQRMCHKFCSSFPAECCSWRFKLLTLSIMYLRYLLVWHSQ